MNCIAFITFNKNKAKTSLNAVAYADMNFHGHKCQGKINCNNVDDISNDFDMMRCYRRGFNSLFGDKYQLTGFDNNAVVLTPYLYDKVLKIFEQYDHKKQPVEYIHVDLDKEKVSRDFIEKKWLVIFDLNLYLNMTVNEPFCRLYQISC